MTRVLVCGGRDFNDMALFLQTMEGLEKSRGPFSLLIHGDAPGADRLAGWWAATVDLGIRKFPANWKVDGKAAGPRRSDRMIMEGKPDLVIAFPGGRGTANCVSQARMAGVEVVEVPPPPHVQEGA